MRHHVAGIPAGFNAWLVSTEQVTGTPKEITGIERRKAPIWGMSGSGTNLVPPRPPRVGEAITVATALGEIRVRVAAVSQDGTMIGFVECLHASSATAWDVHGIRQNDSVVVHGMDFVTLVHTPAYLTTKTGDELRARR